MPETAAWIRAEDTPAVGGHAIKLGLDFGDQPLVPRQSEQEVDPVGHSSAFFSTPETEKLYSGVAKINASAASARNRSTEGGSPRCSTSAL